jgi:hypothetical protein
VCVNEIISQSTDLGSRAMSNQRPFGRRSSPQQQPLRGRQSPDPSPPRAKSTDPDVSIDRISFPREEDTVPHGNAHRDWEESTKWQIKVPWRQVALMASLCFGVAAFVLPDSVNEQLHWILYGLMAMSLYSGLSRRFQS